MGVLSDSASDKGYIYCKIRIQNKVLHLFNTHLQASYMEPDQDLERDLSVLTRLHQVRVLAQKIADTLVEEKYSSSDLVMAVGDFNINGKEGFKSLRTNFDKLMHLSPEDQSKTVN